MPVLLIFMMRMMVVLVVLMVLDDLVVFLGGIFENSISPILKNKKFLESKRKLFAQKNLKIIKTKSKIHLYFRVVHSSIPLVT